MGSREDLKNGKLRFNETWFHVVGPEHEPENLAIVEVYGTELDAPDGSIWHSHARASAEGFIERSKNEEIRQINAMIFVAENLGDVSGKDELIEDLIDLYTRTVDRLGY